MPLTARCLALLPLVAPAALAAQSASLTYRLGRDTVAIEQFTRSATGMTGEMVQRSGPAVVRVTYAVTLGKDGRATAVRLARLQADGTPAPGAPREYRFSLGADSVVREVVFADSTQRRAFPAAKAFVNFPTFVYGPTEMLASWRKGGASDSIAALGVAGGLGYTGLTPLGGDSLRLRGSGYAMVLRFDAGHRLQSVDGRGTTNKVVAERGAGGLDLAAIAARMKPTGTLSLREDTRAGFGAGGIVVVDYGRPLVRERTVWGGTLVPFDSVWRAGANDATHLFTTRTLTFGTVTLAPGMYTLWVQHTRQGTYLIVNRQTGIWGTAYDAAQDVGRVEMQSAPAPAHVEELTITLKTLAPNRGALEIAWGDRVLSVPFAVSAGR
ncbi:MAG TPA: DUF2911 domain-containing protein [Gemmatimonadaceae bacterium]|nr:DUF2911 domain-containing protein [Gemmatimonadaceae bacterium]